MQPSWSTRDLSVIRVNEFTFLILSPDYQYSSRKSLQMLKVIPSCFVKMWTSSEKIKSLTFSDLPFNPHGIQWNFRIQQCNCRFLAVNNNNNKRKSQTDKEKMFHLSTDQNNFWASFLSQRSLARRYHIEKKNLCKIQVNKVQDSILLCKTMSLDQAATLLNGFEPSTINKKVPKIIIQ